jgi:hypothetical protein
VRRELPEETCWLGSRITRLTASRSCSQNSQRLTKQRPAQSAGDRHQSQANSILWDAKAAGDEIVAAAFQKGSLPDCCSGCDFKVTIMENTRPALVTLSTLRGLSPVKKGFIGR